MPVKACAFKQACDLGHSPLVLADEVQVVHPHHEATLHLGRLHHTSKNTATDRHIAGERALLVNVGTCTFKRKSALKTSSPW